MSEIRFYKYEDVNGKERVAENLDFGLQESVVSLIDTKPSTGLFSPGEWISEFLSMPEEECKKYIELFNFDEKETADYMDPYKRFNYFLKNNPRTLEFFQRFIISERFSMPGYSFDINEDGHVEEVYICNNMLEFCTVLMHNVFRLNSTFKKCENCGKWFIPKVKADEKYCLRNSPQYPKKNCRDAARLIKTLERRHTDEAKMEKSLRQMFYNNEEDPTTFNIRNKEWKDNVKKGISTVEEYNKWLRHQYKSKHK